MKNYKNFSIYDFSDYAEEITGDALFKINGGAEVENSHEGVAGANVGDTITRNDGTVVVLNQGDINYANEQLGKKANTEIENKENNSSESNNRNSDECSSLNNTELGFQDLQKDESFRLMNSDYEFGQDSKENIMIKNINKIEESARWKFIPIEGVGINGKSVFRISAIVNYSPTDMELF